MRPNKTHEHTHTNGNRKSPVNSATIWMHTRHVTITAWPAAQNNTPNEIEPTWQAHSADLFWPMDGHRMYCIVYFTHSVCCEKCHRITLQDIKCIHTNKSITMYLPNSVIIDDVRPKRHYCRRERRLTLLPLPNQQVRSEMFCRFSAHQLLLLDGGVTFFFGLIHNAVESINGLVGIICCWRLAFTLSAFGVVHLPARNRIPFALLSVVQPLSYFR